MAFVWTEASPKSLKTWIGSTTKPTSGGPGASPLPLADIDLTFTPFMERVAASNLWLVKSEVHQMFGHYNGSVKTAVGETIPVENLIGWGRHVPNHAAKW